MKPFETEAQLVTELLRCIRRTGRRDWSTVMELDAGVGMADVVLYKRSPRTTRALQLLANINPRLAPLLDHGVALNIDSIESLASALGVSNSSAVRVANELKQCGAARSSTMSKLALSYIKEPPFQLIVALEAKLSHWQQALVQAYRNLQFADESWVVLDHQHHRPALINVERFARSGVGLASIDSSSKLIIHSAARREIVYSRIKRWHAQSALAKKAVSNRNTL